MTSAVPAHLNNGKPYTTEQRWQHWREHDLAKTAGKITVPVNIIQAGVDTTSLPEKAKELVLLFPKGHYQALEGLDHKFQDEKGVVATGRIGQAVEEAFFCNAPFSCVADLDSPAAQLDHM